jgi:hypothetical protein
MKANNELTHSVVQGLSNTYSLGMCQRSLIIIIIIIIIIMSELVLETSVQYRQFTRLVAREDFIEFIRQKAQEQIKGTNFCPRAGRSGF